MSDMREVGGVKQGREYGWDIIDRLECMSV